MRRRAAALLAALASCGGGERSGTQAPAPRPRAPAGGEREPDLDRALTAQATALVDAFVNLSRRETQIAFLVRVAGFLRAHVR